VLVQTPAPGPAADAAPLYTQRWFLITVGAVIVASAVGIWALSRTPARPETPLGNQSIF
jgi:Fe2+ transport system protein B